MVAPTTYSEWSNLLDKFGEGDDIVLEQLSMGSFSVDAGTASRFYSRVDEIYRKRKQVWLDKFQRSARLQDLKSEGDFEIALRNAKQNLSSLNKFIALKSLPNDLRETLRKDLDDFITEIKKSLKDKIAKTTDGREKLLILLSSFGLADHTEEIKTQVKSNHEIIPATGRKIIF